MKRNYPLGKLLIVSYLQIVSELKCSDKAPVLLQSNFKNGEAFFNKKLCYCVLNVPIFTHISPGIKILSGEILIFYYKFRPVFIFMLGEMWYF